MITALMMTTAALATPSPLTAILECLSGLAMNASLGVKSNRMKCVHEASRRHGYPGRHQREAAVASREVIIPLIRRLEPRIGPETVFRLFLSTLRPDVPRLVVDVGANRGSFSLMAAKQGHRVVAFEPVANNIDAFRKNVPSELFSDVRLVTKGVGATPSKFTMRGNSQGKSVAKDGLMVDVGATVTKNGCDNTTYHCHTVEITTIDAEVQEPVFVMKMDIQGFESFALQGAKTLLTKHGVDVLIIEFDPKLQKVQGGSCLRIAKLLWGHGYVLFEGSRLKFEADGSLKSQFARNWGQPQTFERFIKDLVIEDSYTDLIAVHKSLVPPGPFFA